MGEGVAVCGVVRRFSLGVFAADVGGEVGRKGLGAAVGIYAVPQFSESLMGILIGIFVYKCGDFTGGYMHEEQVLGDARDGPQKKRMHRLTGPVVECRWVAGSPGCRLWTR